MEKQYKYIGMHAVSEPVIMATGDVVTLTEEDAEPLLLNGHIVEVEDPDPPKATDAAVRLAEQEGIDLNTVTGTGKDGQITHDDVHAAIEAESHEEGE